MKKIPLFLAVFCAFSPLASGSATSVEGDTSGQLTELIDVPTADIYDTHQFSANFRFYDHGGTLSRGIFGVAKRLNLGIQQDILHLVGSGSPKFVRPHFFFKLRPFDGGDILPALALGYDEQGYFRDEGQDEYRHEEKGLFVTMTHELLSPDFNVTGGVNMFDFGDSPKMAGFVGASWRLAEQFALLAEWDRLKDFDHSRFNMAGRFFVNKFLNVDLGSRNIGRGAAQGAERFLRINYIGRF